MAVKPALFLELLTGGTDQKAVSLLENLLKKYPEGAPLEVVEYALINGLTFNPGRVRTPDRIPPQGSNPSGLNFYPIDGKGKVHFEGYISV